MTDDSSQRTARSRWWPTLGGLEPSEDLDDATLDRGLRHLLVEGVCSQVLTALTSGVFLVAFALHLSATNMVIGFIAAIGPLSQILQMPATLIFSALRMRKVFAVPGILLSRVAWLGILTVPWLVPDESRLAVLVLLLVTVSILTAFASPAYNSWKRDLIPEEGMGRYLASRLAVGTAFAALASLVAGFSIDQWCQTGGNPTAAYTLVFLLGALVGLAGVQYLHRVPEPRMLPDQGPVGFAMLTAPFRDENQRRLLVFLGTWNLAVNFSAPFFTVYMLQHLSLSLALVTALSVTSQVANVAFLRAWGSLADRFSSKSVLSASGPLFILSLLLWPFTTLPNRWALTVPLLFVIHALAGMSTAGVMIGASNITLRAAPRGRATSFIATNALVSGLMATAAPILGGMAADYFATRQLALLVLWRTGRDGGRDLLVPAFDLRGLDFVFIISFLLGLYALHRLLVVREEGEVGERVVLSELVHQMRRAAWQVSSVAGLRRLSEPPLGEHRSGRKPKEVEDPPAPAPAPPPTASG